MSIIYCSDCTREISTEAEAYAEGPLCVNCRKEDTGPNNLSEHPRCECGASGVSTPVATFKDHVIYEVCKHKRVGFYHNGKRVTHCLFCAGSEETKAGDLCPYCKGAW